MIQVFVKKIKKLSTVVKVLFVWLLLMALGACQERNVQGSYRLVDAGLNFLSTDDVVFGQKDATTNLIFFGNYECTFCRNFFEEGLQPLLNRYKGTVKLSFKIVPFSVSIEEEKALRMALSINKYGNFNAYHKLLMKEEKIIYATNFDDYLNGIMQYNQAIADYYYSDEASRVLDKNIELFNKLEIAGTPAFVIGDKLITGYRNLDELTKILDKTLK